MLCKEKQNSTCIHTPHTYITHHIHTHHMHISYHTHTHTAHAYTHHIHTHHTYISHTPNTYIHSTYLYHTQHIHTHTTYIYHTHHRHTAHKHIAYIHISPTPHTLHTNQHTPHTHATYIHFPTYTHTVVSFSTRASSRLFPQPESDRVSTVTGSSPLRHLLQQSFLNGLQVCRDISGFGYQAVSPVTYVFTDTHIAVCAVEGT